MGARAIDPACITESTPLRPLAPPAPGSRVTVRSSAPVDVIAARSEGGRV